MSQVVYAAIDQVGDLAGAKWRLGRQDSYARTKREAESLSGAILLIGRRDKLGLVQLCYARQGYRDGAGWSTICASHVALAVFFDAKLAAREGSGDLRPFFDTIDCPVAAKAVRSLVALECGTNCTPEEKADAVSRLNSTLRTLDVPVGDWTYLPMLAAAQRP